jgi:Fe-S-cluster-containing hydrogenase component 2
VEVVRIAADDFHRMMERSRPSGESRPRGGRAPAAERRPSDQSLQRSLERFLANGLMEAQSLLVLDLEKCTRCDNCVRACADAHDGVTRLIREGLRFENFLVATSCRQCRDPLCMVGCPVGAIRRRNRSKSSSKTGASAAACAPTTAPTATSRCIRSGDGGNRTTGQRAEVTKKKATSCDLCTNHAEPSCVYACPHDAAHRVDPNEFFQQVFEPRRQQRNGRPRNFMRIDRTHRPWAITALVLVVISLIGYVWYASTSREARAAAPSGD